MSGPVDLGHLGQSFADQLRAEMWAIAEQVVYQKLQDHRPRGLTCIPCTIVGPVASLTAPAAHIDVPFPCIIQSVTLRSDVRGTIHVELWRRRPSNAIDLPQTWHDAETIIPAGQLDLVAGTDAEFPAQPVWTTFVEAGATLYPFITLVADFTQITINVIARCV